MAHTKKIARIGLLGAGFVCDLYMRSLSRVRDHEVTAVCALKIEEAHRFAEKWEIPAYYSSMEEVVEHPEVDLVIIGVPHHQHVQAVRLAAAAGKALVCTKPLGRSGAEALECVQAVEAAGVWNGYAETEIFSPAMLRARALVDSGALGKVYWVRFREAHAQIHHFARHPDLNGGGPLRGLGCHGVAVGRWFLGREAPAEVFAWAARLARDDVQTEDSGMMLLRFAEGSLAQVEVGWGHKAGLDTRCELHGTNGYAAANVTGETGLRAFTTAPAGYVMEKAAIDHGWINPVPDEAVSYGFHNEMDHFVHAYLAGEKPWQTLYDGLIDNSVIDTAYRSIQSGRWESFILAHKEGRR